MDKETVKYIVTFFSHLMTEKEKQAIRHVSHSLKIGSTDNNCDTETLIKLYGERGWLTDDQTVLDLLNDGWENFELKTAKRILAESGESVFLNICSNCGKLARTPTAKFCKHCGHDWHEK